MWYKNRRLIAILLIFLLLSGCSLSQDGVVVQSPLVQEQTLLTESQKAKLAIIKEIRETRNELELHGTEPTEETTPERVIYAAVEGMPIYGDVALTNVIGNLNLRDRLTLKETEEISTTSGSFAVIAVNGEPKEGFVSTDAIKMTLEAFIKMPYPDVVYSGIAKSPDFTDNPRIEAKGLYISQSTFLSPKLEQMIEIAKTTEINTFVIDIKDDFENVLFESQSAATYCPEANTCKDMSVVLSKLKALKEADIYLIGRLVTFRSPKYAKRYPDRAIHFKADGKLFSEGGGLYWASGFDETLWAYNIGICKEAAALGFNEIQFDYVRFPAVGSKVEKTLELSNVKAWAKPLAIQTFVLEAKKALEPLSVYISVDIFGWAASDESDLTIGQHWEALSNVSDYLSPMMYPSHYGPGNFGLKVPDAHPYEAITASVLDAKARDANLETPASMRPWIQDFTATWVPGHISYGAEELRAQIKALEDLGIESYLIWDPTNRYAVGGLKQEEE